MSERVPALQGCFWPWITTLQTAIDVEVQELSTNGSISLAAVRGWLRAAPNPVDEEGDELVQSCDAACFNSTVVHLLLLGRSQREPRIVSSPFNPIRRRMLGSCR